MIQYPYPWHKKGPSKALISGLAENNITLHSIEDLECPFSEFSIIDLAFLNLEAQIFGAAAIPTIDWIYSSREAHFEVIIIIALITDILML